MGREWKPGDVAMHPKFGRGIVQDTPNGDFVEFENYAKASATPLYEVASDLRPLVVIDPEQIPVAKGVLTPTWLRNLAADLRRDELSVSTSLENVLLFLADRIEAVVDPKPDEPGTWGVVEASCCHSDERRKWVRHEDDNWWPAEKYSHAEVMVHKGRDPRLPDGWDDLVDPVLVREGVAS